MQWQGKLCSQSWDAVMDVAVKTGIKKGNNYILVLVIGNLGGVNTFYSTSRKEQKRKGKIFIVKLEKKNRKRGEITGK